MRIANEASKLLTNKYFLYFTVFLAATNVLGYLVTNKLNAVIFFALVSLLTYQFSKNMAVILLVALIATNFLMANKRMREGLENETSESTTNVPALDQIDNKDSKIADIIPAVQRAKNNEEVSTQIKSNIQQKMEDQNISTGEIIDSNNTDMNTPTTETNNLVGAGQSIGNRKTKSNDNVKPRLDYAATIEESYKNLDQILGGDSIQKLTGDTQKLMAQQQQLFKTMEQMVPMIEGAKNMLGGFNIDGLTSSLNKIGGIVNGPNK